MKFLAFAALMASPAIAEDPTPQEMCLVVGNLAEVTIDAYYAGVPLSTILAHKDQTDLGRDMAMDAYDEPRYSTDEYIAQATFDFRTRWERECFLALAN